MSYPSNTSACISSSLSLPYLYSVTATILALRAATTNGTPLGMSHTSFAKIRAARSLWGETILPQCVAYPRRARRVPPRPGPLSDGAAPLPPYRRTRWGSASSRGRLFLAFGLAPYGGVARRKALYRA